MALFNLIHLLCRVGKTNKGPDASASNQALSLTLDWTKRFAFEIS